MTGRSWFKGDPSLIYYKEGERRVRWVRSIVQMVLALAVAVVVFFVLDGWAA